MARTKKPTGKNQHQSQNQTPPHSTYSSSFKRQNEISISNSQQPQITVAPGSESGGDTGDIGGGESDSDSSNKRILLISSSSDFSIMRCSRINEC